MKQEIAKLVEKYESDTNRSQSEADVRADYIDLLFLTLGWNVYNEPGQSTNYRREGYIRGAGFIDVGLEVAGEPVLLLEAKKFDMLPRSNQRVHDRTPEEKKLFQYARSKKIPYCILSNFERLHVFNADHERLILSFDEPQEYLVRLVELERLSPDKVKAGSLQAWERQLAIKDVDEAFLASLQDWRLRLANAIYEHNIANPTLETGGAFDFSKLMASVQRILDRLILIRYADDKEVLLTYDVMETILNNYRKRGAYTRHDHLMRELTDFAHIMDDHHNTTIFQPGHICEQVFVPNEVLEKIMDEISSISFRKFTSDILGNTYESYLGTRLVLRHGKIVPVERWDVRRSGGIYYTPTSAVHYIVDSTLGSLLQEFESKHGLAAIQKAMQVKVLDPACGSGSFLIYAYQVLANFYKRINGAIEHERVNLLTSVSSPDMFQRLELFKKLPQPLVDYPHYILENQLYGVDLDPEAAEIAAVNLTMQAFADTKREKLPLILNENVKVGNSLISGNATELTSYFGSAWEEKRPFPWQSEFHGVTANGGFDLVIGNPPWVALTGPRSKELVGKEDVTYFRAKYKCALDPIVDTYALFIEKAASLLADGGYLGFVLPDIILLKNYPNLRRYILDIFALKEIIDIGRAFKHVNLDAICFIAQKERNEEARKSSMVKVVRDPQAYFEGLKVEDLIPQSRFEELPKNKFNIHLTGRAYSLKEKLDSQSFKLGTGWECHEGIHSGNIRDKLFVTKWESARDRPLIFGRDEIDRYFLKWSGSYVRYDPSIVEKSKGEYAGLGKEEHFTVEKILVRRTGDRVIATYDGESFFASNNMFVLFKRADAPSFCEKYSLKFILALLNAKLITAYYRVIQPRAGRLFAELKIEHLNDFPIRLIDFNDPVQKKLHDDLVSLVDAVLDLNKRLAPIRSSPSVDRDALLAEIEQIDREIDKKVYELYSVTDEEKQFIEAP